MTIHMLKLCVGVDEIGDLEAWQARIAKQGRAPSHLTRMVPKRAGELTEGGSLYWVIKGVIQVRQRIVEVREITDRGGRRACELVFDPQLIRVEPVPKRAFQGWRYLKPEDAPADLDTGTSDAPASLVAGLKQAMVW